MTVGPTLNRGQITFATVAYSNSCSQQACTEQWCHSTRPGTPPQIMGLTGHSYEWTAAEKTLSRRSFGRVTETIVFWSVAPVSTVYP